MLRAPLQDVRNEMLVPHVLVYDHQAGAGIKREDCMDGWVRGGRRGRAPAALGHLRAGQRGLGRLLLALLALLCCPV